MKLLLVVVGVLVGSLVIFFGYHLAIDLKIYLTNAQTQSSLQKSTTETKKAYDDLIKQQEARQKASSDQVAPFYLPIPQAKGNHSIKVVFIIPTDSIRGVVSPLHEQLVAPCSETNCSNPSSIAFINSFYQEEKQKYTHDVFSVKFLFNGPVVMPSLEKVGDMAILWEKDPFGVANLTKQFEDLLGKNKITASKEDLVVFLYFENSVNPDTDRFYDGTHFRSFADPENRRAYVNLYDFSPGFASRATEIIAHELLHLFGASDKYAENPTDGICSVKGHGLITPVPISFQTTADIMCGYVEVSRKKFRKGSFLDDTLVINKLTAKEIGWIGE